MSQLPHFHITFSPPKGIEHNWPNGFWAVYQITGDEIAKRITYDGYGIVRSRDSWPGYIGGYGSLAEASAAIEKIVAGMSS